MIFLDSTLIQMSPYCSKFYSAANFKLRFTWLGILYLFCGIEEILGCETNRKRWLQFTKFEKIEYLGKLKFLFDEKW